MAAIVLAQVASALIAPALYGTLAAGASVAAAGGIWALSQGLAGAAGAVIGSAIDRKLFGSGGENAQGPRLSDLAYQGSSDGAALPTVYGTMRLAGTVIWTTGLEETRHKEDVGGGSGGGGTITTYSYKTDVAIALCAGEITGIRRIWADSKLIYDIGETAGVATLIASSTRAASIRVYPGSETQQPDPLIQAVEGAANAPAYRGTAYIVFEDLQLADFGNRIPTFQFEVVRAGTSAAPVTEYTNVTDLANTYSTRATLYDGEGLHIIECLGTSWLHYIFEPGMMRAVLRETRPITASTLPNFHPSSHDYSDEPGKFMPAGNGVAPFRYQGYQKGVFVKLEWPLTGITGACKRDANYLLAGGVGGFLRVYLNGVNLDSLPQNIAWVGGRNTCWIGDDYLFAAHVGTWSIYRFDLGGNYINAIQTGTLRYVIGFESDTVAYTINNSSIYKLDFSNPAAPVETRLFDSAALSSSSPTNTLASLFKVSDDVLIGFIGNYESIDNIAISAKTLTRGTESLKSVADYLCESSGLSVDRYDMSALASDTVRGYVLSQPMTARAAFEPLQTAYHFDLVEEDGKIKAVKRGGSIDQTLATDDLGAAERSGADLITVTRQNDTELPSELSIGYADVDNDYQPGTQYARRLTAQHVHRSAISLPLALTSQEATRLADALLRQAWLAGRSDYQLSLSYEHARLSPGDVITAPAWGATEMLRVTGIEIGAPGLVLCSAVPELAALYISTASGADAAGIGQIITASGATHLALIDCVMLRDVDNAPGWYLGMSGYSDAWPGGVLYKSNDGGASYTTAGTLVPNRATVMGVATTVLGNADCRQWDAGNTVTVRLYTGTLSSSTELAVLNGANAALIGAPGRWELIQYRTATLNGDGTYTLSDLLRGRRGTEYAAARHAVGDAFIVLSTTTLLDVVAPSSEVGADRQFKAVTSGNALENAYAVTYTYAGERLKCLAPVLLGGGRDASGNLTITWVRRDRINAGWNNYSEVPQSESSEAYELEIYTNSSYTTVKRTITGLTSATTSYSSANQVTDFGGNQATVYIRVYQVSASTGRGNYLQGSI